MRAFIGDGKSNDELVTYKMIASLLNKHNQNVTDDLNNFTSLGIFTFAATPKNSPCSAWMIVLVIPTIMTDNDGEYNRTVQFAMPDYGGSLYYRTAHNAGTWNNWTQIKTE